MTYTRATMTKEIAKDLIEQHGSIANAARAILSQCRMRGKPVTFHAVRMWLSDALHERVVPRKQMFEPAESDKLNRIKELLDRANIDVESIGRIDKVKLKAWGVHAKIKHRNEAGKVIKEEIVKDGLYSTNLVVSPSWEDGPAWPVVQPAKPVTVKIATPKRIARDTKTIVVISDTQIGFLRDVEDATKLTPIHDPLAIDLALQIVADVQPDQLGYVGDFLDLPEMSRWLQHEEFFRTTQPAIDEGFKILKMFEAAAGPRARRRPTQFVAGNHDRRLREYVVKNARAAFNLRAAQETPATWPDLTIPRLLHFEELGIQYCGEYPGGEWWITPRLVVRHNPESKDAYDATVIAGHTHRFRADSFSRRTPQGPKFHELFEIGCLCSLENYSDRKSLLATRVPSNRGFVKDWRQGIAVVHVDKEGDFAVEPVRFVSNRKAIYAGRRYRV